MPIADCRYVTLEDMEQIKRTAGQYHGDTKLRLATEAVLRQLGIKEESYDVPTVGLSGIFHDSLGKLVLMEISCSSKPVEAHRSVHLGKPNSAVWIATQARLMQDVNSSKYSLDNAKLGAEIEKVGTQNARMLVVWVDPDSMQTEIFENIDSNWVKLGVPSLS